MSDDEQHDPVHTVQVVIDSDRLSNTPRIMFQPVPEPKAVKNRVHLDLRTAGNPATADLNTPTPRRR